MAIDVARPDVRLYAWEASLDGEGLLSITVTWQVPVPGGFEYVRDTPIVAMNPGDFTLLVFSDITPTADTTLAAAGYTLTGVWPTVP